MDVQPGNESWPWLCQVCHQPNRTFIGEITTGELYASKPWQGLKVVKFFFTPSFQIWPRDLLWSVLGYMMWTEAGMCLCVGVWACSYTLVIHQENSFPVMAAAQVPEWSVGWAVPQNSGRKQSCPSWLACAWVRNKCFLSYTSKLLWLLLPSIYRVSVWLIHTPSSSFLSSYYYVAQSWKLGPNCILVSSRQCHKLGSPGSRLWDGS